MKKNTFEMILKYLKKVGTATRPEIAKSIRRSVRTVNKVVLDDLESSSISTFLVVSGSLGKGSHTNPAVIGLNK